jgi:pSer/pThr/pTyr-binding forkhead associated (FHA) protein
MQTWGSPSTLFEEPQGLRTRARSSDPAGPEEPRQPRADKESALVLQFRCGSRVRERVFQSDCLIGRRDRKLGVVPQLSCSFDDAVSRRHALITRRGRRFYLRDLGSTNGTLYNGDYLDDGEEVALEPDDEIEIGAFTRIRVLRTPVEALARPLDAAPEPAPAADITAAPSPAVAVAPPPVGDPSSAASAPAAPPAPPQPVSTIPEFWSPPGAPSPAAAAATHSEPPISAPFTPSAPWAMGVPAPASTETAQDAGWSPAEDTEAPGFSPAVATAPWDAPTASQSPALDPAAGLGFTPYASVALEADPEMTADWAPLGQVTDPVELFNAPQPLFPESVVHPSVPEQETAEDEAFGWDPAVWDSAGSR